MRALRLLRLGAPLQIRRASPLPRPRSPLRYASVGTAVDRHAPEYQHNQQAYARLADHLRRLLGKAGGDGRAEAIARHRSRGKLSARERVAALLDPGSPFLEVAALAGAGEYMIATDDDASEQALPPGASLVAGVGRIAGRWCMVVANDATVKGGTYFPMTVKKHLRAQEIASACRLPCVYLVDSGGAYLPLQHRVFPDREHFGRIFYNQARMSRDGIAQLAAVMGSCTAGGAYVPAMADETAIVQGTGSIFLGGPPLVKAAIGETVTADELGGAEVHTGKSGVADHFANDDAEALALVRRMVRDLDGDRTEGLSAATGATESHPAPRYDPWELRGILPAAATESASSTSTAPIDMYQVVARLVDDSQLDEFKPRYGSTLVTGWAHLHGHAVGIVANQGVLFGESAKKGAHFIQLCEQRHVPLLFLHNVVGFMVGRQAEWGGIAKDGAKMVNAVACATVPKLSVVVGGSYGAGNYGMCGRAYAPRFLFMLPSARIGVMGGEQAAQVLRQVQAAAAAERGRPVDMVQQYERESSAWFSSAHLWDDGVVLPEELRDVLGVALSVCVANEGERRGRRREDAEEALSGRYGVFRM
ncbi:hypothetical protein CDCA_CDCA12G3508 [Cyanidium caldarium]|uniref:methylcrotonoyl-CoA carboxylase n=1 Tax=Cyanidium caldarium TaxID=2771 RepID=A0AAV9J0D6_CYACA|nr:hypothetical protein CDCA_CDCA12G3508 [Cyanidium caldarium]